MSTGHLNIGKLPGELLGELLASHPVTDPAVIVGPGVGMDAAAIDIGDDVLVVKTDPITFVRERAPLYLVNINANDLACMGARPRWLLVTALFPAGQTSERLVTSLFAELNEACADRGIALVGGHTEITDAVDRIILVGQMLGTLGRDRLLKPGGARPGDRILLTRPCAIEGTALLADELRAVLAESLGGDRLDRAAALLRDPGISVIADAEALLSTGRITALHDPTEGGIATGVRELATAAGVGAVIGRSLVPVLPETAAIASVLDIDPLGMLASGSLLATVPSNETESVGAACAAAGIPFAWIGKILPGERGMVLRSETGESDLPAFATDEVARALATYR